MRWNEIDWDNKIWTIPASRAKNEQEHCLPLSGIALELLQEAKKHTGDSSYVFPSTSDLPMRRAPIGRAVKRHHREWNLDRFTPHDLRRTARTKLAEIGVSDIVAERVLNHKQQGVQAIYNRHRYLEEMREALELWGKALLKIVNEEDCDGDKWRQILRELKSGGSMMPISQ
ncbi:MAG: site-specific integrase [Patescibacteria group bacterium]|nr:site-specific integrase [Patescibacteria group bacterium]